MKFLTNNHVKRAGASLIAMLVTLAAATPIHVLALTPAQKRVFDSGVYYFNIDKDTKTTRRCSGDASSTTPGGSSGQGGLLYFVGDSIGTQVGQPLGAALAGHGWQVQSNAVSGRNLPDGLATIDQDQEVIKTAKAVVIELGTNTAGFTPENVSQMVDKIRGLNPNAVIYWVDTVVVGRADLAQSLNTVNGTIYAQAGQKNYNVVPWNKKVFGEGADPMNINPGAPDSGYINLADGYGVHLSEAGVAAMTELISTTVQAGGGGVSATSCACVAGSATLVGNNNAEIVWNFLIGKGLTPIAAAAVMGNIEQESGYNPQRVQGTPTPEGDHDEITVDGVTGYGLVQWTSRGRQRNLADFAAERGVKSGDLGVQLDFMYIEAGGLWEELNQKTDIRDATLFFHDAYERSGDNATQKEERVVSAINALTSFGSTAPSGGSPSTGACVGAGS